MASAVDDAATGKILAASGIMKPPVKPITALKVTRPNEDLVAAAFADDIAKATALLTEHPGLANGHYSGGNSSCAIHWACTQGNADMVKLLLKFGADPNARSNDLSTPLQCVLCASFTLVSLPTTTGSPHSIHPRPLLPLSTTSNAVWEGQDVVTQVLLDAGADPTLQNSQRKTAFQLADGEEDVIKVLQAWMTKQRSSSNGFAPPPALVNPMAPFTASPAVEAAQQKQ